MKKLFCLLLTLALALSLAACGGSKERDAEDASGNAGGDGASPFQDETLVVGVWGGPIESVLRESVVTPMEEEFGCNIELVLGGTSERKAKMYAEVDNPSMDVLFLNIYESKQAVDDGVAQEVDSSLSNFGSLYDFAQTGGYGMSIMGLGIGYNHELVTEPITSWKDLWREELKGKVALSTMPGFENDAFIALTAQAWGLDLKTQEDEVFAKIAELGPFPLFYNDLDELFLEMKQGVVLAAAIFNSYSNDYIEQGFPVTFVYPNDPGAILAKDTIVIAKNTAHEALAKEFVNRCIGVEAQTAYAENIFFSPCNKDVIVADEVAKKLVYGDDVKTLVTLDWDYILEHEDAWTDQFNRMVEGN